LVTLEKQRCEILGVEVDNLTTRELLEKVQEFVESGTPHQVVYQNIDTVNRCAGDPAYRRIVSGADLVYADGMGVVLASRLFSTPLKERVNAGDFLPDLCRAAEEKGWRMFLLGGEPGVAERARERLLEDHPRLQVVGARDGFFEEAETPAIIEEVRRADPHILLVGMGSPRQEKWIHRNLKSLDVPVAWGVGGLFDYYSGRLKRAPAWMRRWGLEWMYRLLQEPRRLWQRYLVGNLVFGARIAVFAITDVVSASLAWFAGYASTRWYRSSEFVNGWLDRLFGISLSPLNEITPYVEAIPVIVVLWVGICVWAGLYRRRRDITPLEEMRSILVTTLVYAVCASAIAFLGKGWSLGRGVVLLSAAYNFLFIWVTRAFYRWIQSRFVERGFGRHRTLIVGAGSTGLIIKRRMENHPLIDHEILGFVDDAVAVGERVDGAPVVGGMDHLLRLIDEHEVDEVFFANPGISQNEILNCISRYRKARTRQDVTFKVATEDMFQFIASRVNLEEVDSFPVVELKLGERSAASLAAKRLIDIGVALALVPFAVAATIAIVPLIKLVSPGGPAVFRHERVGRSGKRFIMYKFRTMHPGVDEYAEAPTVPNDPRVIPIIGNLLRRTSLDELPQIWNVLRGDMSMVGPRPEMPFIVEGYDTDWQRLRLAVKPGITGLWQIIGRKDVPLHGNLEYDYYYVQNQSFMLDLLILLKTIPTVLLGKGAY